MGGQVPPSAEHVADGTHLAVVVRVAADREKPRPARPNVPVDVGDGRPVDVKLCTDARVRAWVVRRSGACVPEARGLVNVMFLTPLEDAPLARGMFARMRAAASACLAWTSALESLRAAASSPPSAVAARSGRRACARERSIARAVGGCTGAATHGGRRAFMRARAMQTSAAGRVADRWPTIFLLRKCRMHSGEFYDGGDGGRQVARYGTAAYRAISVGST